MTCGNCSVSCSLMLNLDKDIPGARLYLMKKRGIFKTSRFHGRRTPACSREEMAEVDFRLEALRPWLMRDLFA